MCGIAGYVGETKNPSDCLAKMAKVINHRGPDSNGIWTDQKRIGLAHTRLSILDLSPAGHQPMHSTSGNYVLIFLNETY